MRLLIIHQEAEYFAGAEKVLGYYLEGLLKAGTEVAVAVVPGAPTVKVIPAGVKQIALPKNQRFSPVKFQAQVRAIKAARSGFAFDVIHGWSARDWELAAAASVVCGCASVGTLHDHPQAGFHSRARQFLMRTAGKHGLDQLVCVSDAVARECVAAGYPADKLATIHNGLPECVVPPKAPPAPPWKFGYLGAFSGRKGIEFLFEMTDRFASQAKVAWELHLAGAAQGEDAEAMMARLRDRYSSRAWWPRLKWPGWVSDPMSFLAGLDLLILPSSEFDPLPTVLIEAGATATPVLAASVGGVSEIVIPDETGWIFPAGDVEAAAQLWAAACANPLRLRTVGEKAREHVRSRFATPNMVQEYQKIYACLTRSE